MIKVPEHLKRLAGFVERLLDYDADLIHFDRTETQQSDINTSYIVVNGAQQSNILSNGRNYNGETEIMNYNTTMQKAIILEFYGDGAYTNSEAFLIMSRSQEANEIKRSLGLTTYEITSYTDVKQILGSQYGNRVHIEFNITYTPNTDISVLRIDETQFEFKTED